MFISAMKLLFLFFSGGLLVMVGMGCNGGGGGEFSSFAQAYNRASDGSTVDSSAMQWEATFKDLGTVKKGGEVDIKFSFTNTGEHPIVIDSAFVNCGCTLISIPEAPVMPGKESYIVARYVTREQPTGAFLIRNIYLRANTIGSPYHTLGFKVMLKEN